MARRKKEKQTGARLGFEEKLWQTADKLRNNMDAAEYKHVVLGLIFLKYIYDAFEERWHYLEKETMNPENIDYYVKDPKPEYIDGIVEDKDEYGGKNVFLVPWGRVGAISRGLPETRRSGRS